MLREIVLASSIVLAQSSAVNHNPESRALEVRIQRLAERMVQCMEPERIMIGYVVNDTERLCFANKYTITTENDAYFSFTDGNSSNPPNQKINVGPDYDTADNYVIKFASMQLGILGIDSFLEVAT